MEAYGGPCKGVRRVLVLLIVNGKLDTHHKAKVNIYTPENTVSKIIYFLG